MGEEKKMMIEKERIKVRFSKYVDQYYSDLKPILLIGEFNI